MWAAMLVMFRKSVIRNVRTYESSRRFGVETLESKEVRVEGRRSKEVNFLPAATARSIDAVSPPPSGQRTIEHGSIETNELNMTYESCDPP